MASNQIISIEQQGGNKKIKRPSNCFFIFSKMMRPNFVAQNPEREFYKKEAEKEKEKHSQDNPGYKYRPKRKSNSQYVRPNKKAKFDLHSHSHLQNAYNGNTAPQQQTQQQQPPLHHEQLTHQKIHFLTNPFYQMTFNTATQLQQPQQHTDFYTNPSYQMAYDPLHQNLQ
ncbi:hypothetical protein HELRODRAFT_178674 [Helobdella robusta]|uniref:Sex-determining region Y protein n=1 Tax=Helobdella robusta TaxID=6412 RepID=T1FDJ9_HELRO|nr:hypothetical protein HELRODRAFT_178674 [Helobdella robusta]ESN96875.1 hypothetical protein HELRODRAFT_178674 [Helobdella robusta]